MQQFKKLMHKSILTLIGFALIAFSSVTLADQESYQAYLELLKVAKTKSEKCVDDTSFMRSNHMEKILHQRDDTMRKGVRGEAYSLKECISCHVPENANVHYGDKDNNGNDKHFCSSCHSYAAVTIDCFQCHADRNISDNKQSSINPHKQLNHYAANSDKQEVSE